MDAAPDSAASKSRFRKGLVRPPKFISAQRRGFAAAGNPGRRIAKNPFGSAAAANPANQFAPLTGPQGYPAANNLVFSNQPNSQGWQFGIENLGNEGFA